MSNTLFYFSWFFFRQKSDQRSIIVFGLLYRLKVRDWVSLLPESVHMKNAYRDRKPKPGHEKKKVPQSFTFVPREGHSFLTEWMFSSFKVFMKNWVDNWTGPAMSQPLTCAVMRWSCPFKIFQVLNMWGMPDDSEVRLSERIPRRLKQDERWLDIFCCVRQNMSDDSLCQEPLLVMPQSLIGETQYFLDNVKTASSVTPWLAPERMEELRDLANEIEIDFPHMMRAVKYYRSLLEATSWEPYPEIKFLGNVTRAGNRWCQFNLGERQPRPKPHLLEVVFHRGRGGGWINAKQWSASRDFDIESGRRGKQHHRVLLLQTVTVVRFRSF